jgi:hypothetical protein
MLTDLTQCTSKWKSFQKFYKQRAVFEFLTAERVSPIEIHRRMQAVYGDQYVDVSTVRLWVRLFKDGELGQADLIYNT